MKIDGAKIADIILTNLQIELSPHIFGQLAVILIGTDKNSQIYVNQKIKTGRKLGIPVSVYRYNTSISIDKLTKLVDKLNLDNQIQGIIIQRPVPLNLKPDKLNLMIRSDKDVDGFHPRSLFDPPVALAIAEILKSIHPLNYLNWLKNQKILIIGRGETAGKPIAKYFSKKCLQLHIAHSQTTDLKKLCLACNIIIPCVGRPNIVRHDMVKSDSILIGVGLHPEENKLRPDYQQEDIGDKVGFYTPVPGGVGPVNVAMLFKNLIKAASQTL